MSEITYHRSQIIIFDPHTVVCWWEDEEGRAGDILCEEIPDDAEIVDHDAPK